MIRQRSRILTTATIFLCGILTACSSNAPKKVTPKTTSVISNPQNPEALLGQAAIETNLTRRNQLLFDAAMLYKKDGLIAQSQSILNELDPSFLNAAQQGTIVRLQLQQSVSQGDVEQTNKLLANLQIEPLLHTSIDEQVETIELMTQAYELTERYLDAATLLISQRGILLNDELNNDRIWQHLRLSDALEVAQAHKDSDDYDIKGWLELLNAIRFRQNDLHKQYEALTDWTQQWEFHPAAMFQPHELSILAQLPETQAKEIILALPFSGPLAAVGNAIRDGFSAQYYQSSQFGSLNIRFYDTHQNDFLALYDEALDPNSIIIGPLEKTLLKQLVSFDSVPVKTIALNQVTIKHQVQNLYQFSLNPEHETRQILERLDELDKSRIAILAPENDWGLRVYNRLAEDIGDKDLNLVSSSFYQGQKSLSKSVAALLNTDQSKARARRVRQITGLALESTPRRRQDIDAVLMLATPEFARQLNPLLAYHYASDLPVFATSQINTGEKKASNRDLNGIQFLDMPWALSKTIPIKNQINNSLPTNAARYSRFYAMGVDAFNLAPRIDILTQVINSHINGQTGLLSIDENNQVARSLQWAKFRGENPVILN